MVNTMYSFTLLNTSQHIATSHFTTNDYVFFAIVEANEKDPETYNKDSGFDALFLDAMKSIQIDIAVENLPLEMAKSINKVLLNWHQENFGPRTVLYAGVLLENNKINVCTAGDCRVHLIENNKITAVTRDHNLIDDPVDGISIEDDTQLRYVYLGASTRVLGVSTNNRKPESLIWDTNNSYTILICSSQFHLYKQPEEYLDLHLQKEQVKGDLYNSYPSGVLIKIEKLESKKSAII